MKNMKGFGSLAAEHAVGCALLVAVGAGCTGALAVGIVKRQMTQTVLRQYPRIVERVAMGAGFFLGPPRSIVPSLASLLRVDDLRECSAVMTAIVARTPSLKCLMLVSPEGRELASTSALGIGFWRYDLAKSGVPGALTMGPVRADAKGDPYVEVAAPVRRNGVLFGVIAAQVDLAGMKEYLAGIAVGKGSRAYAVDASGAVIAGPDAVAGARMPDVCAPALPADAEPTVRQVGCGGRTVIEASAPMEPAGWRLVVRQDAADAYVAVAAMQRVLFAASAVIVLVAAFAGFAAGITASRRVTRLARRIESFSYGDLTPFAGSSGGDEYAQAARALDAAAARMRVHDEQMHTRSSVAEGESGTAQLAPIARSVRALFKDRCRERGIALFADVPSTLPSVAFDEVSVKRILVTLVAEACEAMHDGGAVKISARPAVREAGARVELRVSDNGPGIAGDRLGSASRLMVERLGGSVRCDTTEGQGTTYVVELPIADKGVS